MPREKPEAIASSTVSADIFISPADSGRIVMDPEAEITVSREPDSEVTAPEDHNFKPPEWGLITPEVVARELLSRAFTPEDMATARALIEGAPVGYTALLAPLRSVYPAPILPEPPITDAEWSAMVEAIQTSEEDVIALPVPASCFDEFTLSSPDPAGEATTIRTLIEPRLRQCADALRVTACALGVGLTFYPRKAGTHTIREGKERREEVVPAALMARRMS